MAPHSKGPTVFTFYLLVVSVSLHICRWPGSSTTNPSLPFLTSAPVQWVWMWRISSTATAGRYVPQIHVFIVCIAHDVLLFLLVQQRKHTNQSSILAAADKRLIFLFPLGLCKLLTTLNMIHKWFNKKLQYKSHSHSALCRTAAAIFLQHSCFLHYLNVGTLY